MTTKTKTTKGGLTMGLYYTGMVGFLKQWWLGDGPNQHVYSGHEMLPYTPLGLFQ
jgi:hypothetical protein